MAVSALASQTGGDEIGVLPHMQEHQVVALQRDDELVQRDFGPCWMVGRAGDRRGASEQRRPECSPRLSWRVLPLLFCCAAMHIAPFFYSAGCFLRK